MTGHHQYHRTYIGSCPCGKRGYLTRRDAKRAAKETAKSTPPDANRGHLDVYPCRLTDSRLFHIGHLPPAVIRGNMSRDQIIVAARPTRRNKGTQP